MTNIIIQKNEARVVNTENLVSGTTNAYYVQFSLSADWDSVHKTAVFSNGDHTIAVLDNKWRSESVCAIPPEVLQTPNKIVRVGLKGTLQKELLLATPMCGIGKVQMGTDPTGDKTTDPSLPVWEQLREEFSTRSYDCTTSLEKVNSGENGDTILRIRLENLANVPNGASLHLYRCVRNRSRRSYWQHPVTHDGLVDGNQRKWGYGLIVNELVAYDGDESYPEIPNWMPNNGFMKTEYAITPMNRKRGYVDISLTYALLPLLKPIDANQNWEDCGFVGLQGDGRSNPLLLRFRICKNGKPIDIAGDTFRVGIRSNYTPEADHPILVDGRINPHALYTRIN